MSLSDGVLSTESRTVLRKMARMLRDLPSENSTADLIIHHVARVLEQLAAAQDTSTYSRMT